MGNLILWTAAKEFTEVTNLEKGRVSDVTISNNKSTWDKAGTSVQQSVDYNGVKIDSTNGINVTSSQNTLLLNASKGIELKKKSTSETIFGVDTNGNLTLKGNINMVGGSIAWDSLTGQNPAPDATNTWKDVTTDSRYSGLFYTANGKLLLKADAVIIGSNTKFDDGYDPTKIELGASNLVVNGAFLDGTYNGWSKWGNPSKLWVDGQNTIKDSPRCISMEVNGANQGLWQDIRVTVGQTYTLSAWVWCKTGATIFPTIMANNAGTYPGVLGTKFETWERISVTFVAKSTTVGIYIGRSGAIGTGTYSFVSVQLEEGNKVTDWKPSYKDVDKAVADVNNTVNNINIGGKNLILKSNESRTTTDYLVKEYTLTENWVPGQEYTFVMKGTLPAGQIWGLWVNGSANRVAEVKTTWINGLMYVTFTCIAITAGFERALRLYNTPQNTTSSTVEWVALYKGNKPMDWMPAPEDVSNSINGISVGTRNLITGTMFTNPDGWLKWGAVPSTISVVSDAFNNFNFLKMESIVDGKQQVVGANTPFGMYNQGRTFEVKKDTEYTLSMNVATSELNNVLDYMYIIYSSGGTNQKLQDITTTNFPVVTPIASGSATNYYKVSFTFIPTRDDKKASILIGGKTGRDLTGSNGYAWIRINNLKIEVGNKVTDWSPAPEDFFNYVDNMDVGGNNILLNTDFRNGMSNWSKMGGATQSIVDVTDHGIFKKANKMVISTAATDDNWIMADYIVAPGDYVLSAYFKSESAQCSLGMRDGNVAPLVYNLQVVRDDMTGKNQWFRVSIPVTFKTQYARLYFGSRKGTTNGTLYVTGMQLEAGTKLTGWKISTDDLQGQISDLNTDYSTNKINWNSTQTIVNAWKGPAEGGVTTIKGGLLQTGTITANKLFLGDTTNLCENPDFENDANGATPTGFTSNAHSRVKDISGFAGGNGSNKALELDAINGYNNDMYSNSFIPVTPGQQFYVEAEARFLNSAGSGAGRLGFSCYNAKKQHMNTWSSAVWWSIDKNIAQPVFTKKGATWTVPANCYYVYIWISFQNNGETTNKWYIDNIRINRAASAELIVDGSITSRHIQADSITGDRIQANSLSADRIRIASFENLYTNGTFELGDVNWKANGGTSYQILKDPNTSYQGNWYMRIPHDGKFNDIFDSNEVYVMPGEKYYFDGYARVLTGTANTRTFIVQWLNKDGGIITHNYPTEALTTSWKKISYVIEAPAAAVKMKVGLSVGGLNTAGQYTLFCNVFCRRQSAGELLVDGTITATKLNVGDIFGNSAVINKIQTYDLSANRIVSGNLEVGGSQLFTGTAWAISGKPTSVTSGLSVSIYTTGGEDYLITSQNTATEKFVYLKRVPLVGGKKITVSFDYNIDSNVKGVDLFVLASKTDATEANLWSTGFDYQYATADTVHDEKKDLGNNWFRVRKTFTLANDVKSAFLRLDHNGTNNGAAGSSRFRSIMVNYGNLAMDWQPHSDEDLSIGSITARQIAANSISAREIVAGSITANELSVLAKQLVNNFSITKNFDNYNIAGNTGVFSIVNDPLNQKGSVLKMTTGADIQIQSDFFEVNPSKTYRLKVSAYVPTPTATTSVYFGFYAFDENKKEIPAASYVYEFNRFDPPKTNGYFFATGGAGALTFNKGWVDMEAVLANCNASAPTDIPASKIVPTAYILPSNARYVKMRFFHHYSKTVIDSYWAHPSVTEVDSGLFTFDQAQGGTLKLGTDTGNGFLQVVKQGSQGQKETVGQIDETGAYFPKIQADKIVGGGVVGIEQRTGQIFFDSINGNDNNDGTRAKPKRNIQAYIDQMSKYISDQTELIQLNGNIDSPIIVKGFFGPGHFTIKSDNSANRWTINSGIVVRGVHCNFFIQHFILQGRDDTMAQTGTDSMIDIMNSPNVDIWFCKIYANKKVNMGITAVRGGGVRCTDLEIYDVKDRAFSIIYNATAYIKACKGGRNPCAILVSDFAVVQGEGSRPDGTIVRWANAYVGGYTGGGDRWVNDVWTVDFGEATPPPPPPPSEYVREWASLGGANWSQSGYWDDEWYVKQGNWGYGDRIGIWWFPQDMKNTLSGKTILDAQILLTRANKGGYSGSREARIVAHQYADQRPGNWPGVSQEFVSAWFSWGEQKWVNVTSFVQQKIANGVDKGLGLRFADSNANYMAFDYNAKIWVKYK